MKVQVALLIVASICFASAATNATCPKGKVLTCKEGHRIGKLCYGECPKGYFATDKYATPINDEVDGNFPGPRTYCWQECHGNVFDTYDDTTCGNYSIMGQISTLPSYAGGDGELYPNETSCVQDYPNNGCEECNGQWSPLNDCGAPSCSMFCPVKCPKDMKQISSIACQRHSFKRPVVGHAKCAPIKKPHHDIHNGEETFGNGEEDFGNGEEDFNNGEEDF